MNWGDDFAKDTVLEKKQLTYLSFEEADTSAKKMMDLLHLSGYELTWALDMDLDRIKALGKEYNEYWYESGSGFTNSPRYDYDLATAEDEGYYLIYKQARQVLMKRGAELPSSLHRGESSMQRSDAIT